MLLDGINLGNINKMIFIVVTYVSSYAQQTLCEYQLLFREEQKYVVDHILYTMQYILYVERETNSNSRVSQLCTMKYTNYYDNLKLLQKKQSPSSFSCVCVACSLHIYTYT